MEGWVDELSRVIAHTELNDVTLDLTNLTFVDQRGVALLRDLSARGVSVVGGSSFVQALLWGETHDCSI